MFCKNCGSPQKDTTPFCTSCGNAITPPPEQAKIIDEIATGEMPVSQAQVPADDAHATNIAPPAAFDAFAPIQEPQNDTANVQATASPPEQAPYSEFTVPPEYAVAPPAYDAAPAVAQGPNVDPTKRRSKKILLLVCGLVVVLAGIGVALFLLFSGGGSAQEKVENAFEKAFSIMAEERDAATLQLGISTIINNLAKVPSATEFKIGIDNIPGSYTPPFSLNVSSQSDPSAEKTDTNIALQFDGTTALSLQVQRSGDILSFLLPQMFKDAIGFDMSTFSEDIRNSSLANIDEDLNDLLESFASAIESAATDTPEQDANYSPLSEATNTQLSSLYETLWSSAKSSKGGSVSTEVNGFTKKADMFTVTIPKASVVQYLSDSSKALFADDYFTSYKDIATSALNGYSPEEIDATIAELLRQLDTVLASDLSLVCYIQKDHIIKMEASIDISIDSSRSTMGIMIVAEFGGEENLSDAFSFSVGVPDQSTWLRFSAMGNHVPVNGIFSSNIILEMETSGMKSPLIDISIEYDSNKTQDNFNATLTVPSYLQTPLAQMSGAVNIDVANSHFSIELSRFFFSNGYEEMDLSLAYKTQKSDPLTFPTLTPTMLFNMSEDELEALYDEILLNAENLTDFFS